MRGTVPASPEPEGISLKATPRKRVPLGRSGERLSFERRLRVALYLMGAPTAIVAAFELHHNHVDASIQWIVLVALVLVWAFAVSLILEQITRPLQTLANVVAALREDDYSFRARGGRRNDALGDLALEINALAGMLQVQRVGAMEAMALVERVMKSMQSPVLAFDPSGKLKLLNAAAERAFNLGVAARTNGSDRIRIGDKGQERSREADLDRLLQADDNALLALPNAQPSARWVVKRTSFRLRGVPHTLFVLSDVSHALREEEKQAWERLIRVLGHEINNSLTPIKSIAGSLRALLASRPEALELPQTELSPQDETYREDFNRGLEVIEDRAASLNRFLQAYRELMGLPAPNLESISLSAVVRRVAQLETRISVKVITPESNSDVQVAADADQLAQALINLVRNATEAALSPDAANGNPDNLHEPSVEITWRLVQGEASIVITDNGPGLTNAGNLFVPFYTTKPEGTGIGLVLAQQIALAHSGSVQLANREDRRGCRALFRLPLLNATVSTGQHI